MLKSKSPARVPSPCVSICALNDDDVCVGCYRTAEEIRNWVMLDDDERIGVVAEDEVGRRAREKP